MDNQDEFGTYAKILGPIRGKKRYKHFSTVASLRHVYQGKNTLF
jgi:hypothetical protein